MRVKLIAMRTSRDAGSSLGRAGAGACPWHREPGNTKLAVVSDNDIDGLMPHALEQEWTVKFVIENIAALPTEWLYASLAVCEKNWYLSYSPIVGRHIEHELLVRKSRFFH